MSEFDDFDFIDSYGEAVEVKHENQLPDNDVETAITVGVVGIGGGGGKLAKAFIEQGYNKTILINTTEKDQPMGLDEQHLVLVPGSDGAAKDVSIGKKVFSDNSAVVEDALRTKLGKVDWLIVCAGGGGGTGSSTSALSGVFDRYLASVQGEGSVIYVTTKPTAQEMLNSTIRDNASSLNSDLSNKTQIVLDNEKQVQLLRGKVGMLGMYPTANTTFVKLLTQVLKLAGEKSPIQSFDSKDLERCLKTPQRMFLGSTIAKETGPNLGAELYQNCLRRSPCPEPKGKPKTGAMLLVITPEMADDPEVSKHLDAAVSYVGGRTETLFSGVYIRENLPGLVAILALNGLDQYFLLLNGVFGEFNTIYFMKNHICFLQFGEKERFLHVIYVRTSDY